MSEITQQYDYEENKNIILDSASKIMFDEIREGIKDKDDIIHLSPEIVSMSKYIRFNTIIENIDYPWDYNFLLLNPNVPKEFINDNTDKIDFNIKTGSLFNFIEKIICSKNTSLELIKANYNFVHLGMKMNLDYYSYIDNPNMTIDKIEEYINNDIFSIYHMNILSSHDKITKEFIDKYIDKGTDWFHYFYKNKNLTLDIIDKNIDNITDFEKLGYNENITLEFVKKHSSKPWNSKSLSSNHHFINIENIDECPDIYFSYEGFLQNDSITLKYLRDNIDKQKEFISSYYNGNIDDDKMDYLSLYSRHDLDMGIFNKITCKFTLKEIYDNDDLIWNYEYFNDSRLDGCNFIDEEYFIKFNNKGYFDYESDYHILYSPHISSEVVKRVALQNIDCGGDRQSIYNYRKEMALHTNIGDAGNCDPIKRLLTMVHME